MACLVVVTAAAAEPSLVFLQVLGHLIQKSLRGSFEDTLQGCGSTFGDS